jgi:hypothetical protein
MSTIGTLFEINGVISTDKSVMQNINTLCTSAGAWMTYDIAEGKWSVVINRAGASISSFNDSNIIGGINISGTGVNELYNSATIEYPHKDLRDQTDYIDLEIPAGDRFPYELDNRLNIKLDCINNPVTAQYLASVELKQSRIDKVIQFRTDYSKIGLKAGDIIDVTNSVYGYTAKKFRITKVEEEDTEGLAISITALEYDENVYSTDGLIRKIREKKTGIVPKDNNQSLTSIDNQASLKLALTPGAIAHGLGLYYLQSPTGGTWYISYNEATPAYINAGGAVINWVFSAPGKDLDMRAKIVSPNMGQTIYVGYRGSGQIDRWPASGTAAIVWGGDNTGSGLETVAVNVNAIKAAHPTTRYIVIECRAIWGRSPDPVLMQNITSINNPVTLSGTVWEGGTIVPSGFTFVNPTAIRAVSVASTNITVTASYKAVDEADGEEDGLIGGVEGTEATIGNNTGQFMNYWVYDTQTENTYFSATNPAA